MAVDEYGREPGVDYSDQTWVVVGETYTDVADADAAAAE